MPDATLPNDLHLAELDSPAIPIPSQLLARATAPGTQQAKRIASETPSKDEGPHYEFGPVGRDVNIFNQADNRAASSYDEKLARTLDEEELSRASRLFVEPPGFESFLRSLETTSGSLCFITGADHSGKNMCAIRVAVERRRRLLKPSCPLIVGYNLPSGIDFSLRQFCLKAPKNRIYIIRDIFRRGFSPARLAGTSEEYSSLIEVLEQQEIHLILTTEEPESNLSEILAPKFQVGKTELVTVLTRHLEWYAEKKYFDEQTVTRIDDLGGQIAARFYYPIHAQLFCSLLVQSGDEEMSDEAILKLAREVTRAVRAAVRGWFRKLPENAKLYAMLVGLFDGLPGPILDELYVNAARYLRQDGLDTFLDDPREHGIDDLKELAHVQSAPDLGVTFSLPIYASEAYEQINNYNETLWSLRSVFIALIQQHSEPHFWYFRRALGTAIGVLSAAHKEKLSEVLRELALHDSKAVAAVAGFVMEAACRHQRDRREDVIELLHTWIKSHRRALMWAAGAALWKIYPEAVATADADGKIDRFREDVLDTLKLLAIHAKQFSQDEREELWRACQEHEAPRLAFLATLVAWTEENYDCFVFAVHRMMAIEHRTMVTHLRTWLLHKDGLLCHLARSACRSLFMAARDRKDAPPLERRQEMLCLLHPLLESCRNGEHQAAEVALASVRLWLEWGDDEPRIFQALLEVANDQDPLLSFLLRRSLADFWLDSESPSARLIAQRLITRSLALQGMPMHLPGTAYGVLVVDGSEQGMAEGISARAAVLLRAVLDCQLETFLVRLGRERRLAAANERMSTLELRRESARPRLLLPALEGLEQPRLSLLLLLSWGELIDLADLPDTLPVDDIRLVAAGYEPAENEGVRVMATGSAMTWPDIHRIESWLTWTRARRLASVDFASWWPSLAECLQLDNDEDRGEALCAWAERLHEAELASGEGDLAKLLNAAFLSWAGSDPASCFAVLSLWLREEDSQRRRIALAASRQIMNVLAHDSKDVDRDTKNALLSLATSMIGAGWAGAEAVFYLVRHLVAQHDWYNLFVHGSRDLPDPLTSWIDALLPDNEQRLRILLESWESKLLEEDWVPAVVDELVPLMRLRLSLGAGKVSDLVDDKPYYLVVIDSAPPSLEVLQLMLKLAGELGQRFRVEGHPCLVYRLGYTRPMATADEEVAAERLFPQGTYKAPRLLAPILEDHDFSQVKAVLLITSESVVDRFDLSDTPWIEKIKVSPLTSDTVARPFFRIPEGDADSIANHLIPT